MVAAAWTGAADADVTVLMIEAHRGLTEGAQAIIDTLTERGADPARTVLAINKIDRVKSEPSCADTQAERGLAFAETFMISAERGIDRPAHLSGRGAAGRGLYPEDQIADLPLRMLAAEMTREKLTLRLHQELPYQLTVETEAGKSARTVLLRSTR